MSLADEFPDITRVGEPLAPHTHLRVGGPAEFFVRPRSVAELRGVLKYCADNAVPLRMLGGGFNLLVRDEPVPGAVVRLAGPAFESIAVEGRTARAAGGAALFDLIAATVRAGLSGLETLVGIRGSVGGSVRCNVGDRAGEIGASVRRVCVLTAGGTEQVRGRDELTFGDHSSDLDEPAILWVEFELERDDPALILKRLRRTWVVRKGAEPWSFQPAVRMFRDAPGSTAAHLVERAGLSRTRVGNAEVSDRNGNYAVANPGTTARDILKLVETVQARVREASGVSLQRELNVW
jgi:UDP-N-acetylmuramate dehydrogenase